MDRHIATFRATLFALILGATSGPQPAKAVQADVSLAAESCIAYQPDGNDSYRLANRCDYAVDIAFCSQPKADPGLCLRTQSWNREIMNPQSQSQGKILPEQALDLFACRTPGKVEILPSGMARCTQPPAQAVMPLLLSASLKNPGAILTDKDYPPSHHNMEGTTRFELIVSADGKPVSCTTTVSSGFDVLDKAACNAFAKRARFSPAKDENGNPTAGRYKGSVTWKAP